MENKYVGWLLVVIAVFIAIIILLFSNTTKSALDTSCPIIEAGNACPAYSAIDNVSYLGWAITGLLIIIGLFLAFSKPKERIIIREIEKKVKPKKIDTSEVNLPTAAELRGFATTTLKLA